MRPSIYLFNLEFFLLAIYSSPPLPPTFASSHPYLFRSILIERVAASTCLCPKANPLDTLCKTVQYQNAKKRTEDSHDGRQESDCRHLTAQPRGTQLKALRW